MSARDELELMKWESAYKRLQDEQEEFDRHAKSAIEARNERIAELESILRDIVADSDYSYQDGKPYPAVTWTSINRAKRLLKMAPFDK